MKARTFDRKFDAGEDIVDQLDQIENRHRQRLPLGITEEAACQRGAGRAGPDDVDQAVPGLRGQTRLREHGFGIGLNAHDEIVEVMRHPAGQFANGLQLFLVDRALRTIEPMD